MTKKNKFNIFLVLDETGSMERNKEVTLSAINEYFDSLRKDKNSRYRVSVYKFNGAESEFLFDNIKLKKLPTLTDEHYNPRNSTPLYDAVGFCINHLKNKKNVLFVITTDGEENSSYEYKREDIYDLIKKKRKAGWQFVFMGADLDAYKIGYDLGLQRGQTLSFNSHSSKKAYDSLYVGTVSYTASGNATDEFFEETDIREE